jgi:HPt (histidine-containing phosphotransfer) domain-containing protein
MINLENFNENFKYYGNDVVVQIIDMFVEDHQEDLKMINQNINNKDFLSLRFNAHHLKGSIANFMDPVTTELTSKLEEMGETKTEDGLVETFDELQSAAKVLLKELLKHRKQIVSQETCFS